MSTWWPDAMALRVEMAGEGPFEGQGTGGTDDGNRHAGGADGNDDGPQLSWTVRMTEPPFVRGLNAAASALPEAVARRPPALAAMARVADAALGLGDVTLSGTAPNGQRAVVLPRRLYPVVEREATLAGEDLGRPAPVPENPAIGGFRLPARPAFAVGRAYFEILDPAKYARTAAARWAAGAAGRGLVDRG